MDPHPAPPDPTRSRHGQQPTPAAASWAEQLAGWGVPDEILRVAPRSPWIVPVSLFRVDDPPADGSRADSPRADSPGADRSGADGHAGGPTVPDSPSRHRARQALPAGGSVLDVGCGGGRAGLAVSPPADLVIGVDTRTELLQAFAAAADRRGLRHQEVHGRWPQVAEQVPVADVVLCHHVAYDVADLGGFALALDRHARARVVLELSDRHPLAYLAPLWERFWGLTRPAGPTAGTALEVLREAGLPARLERWEDATPRREAVLSPAQQVELVRIRLCLPAERDPEIAEALRDLPPRTPRTTATLWWEGSAG